MGVIVAFLTVYFEDMMKALNMEHTLVGGMGAGMFQLLGVVFFCAMGFILYKVARSK